MTGVNILLGVSIGLVISVPVAVWVIKRLAQ